MCDDVRDHIDTIVKKNESLRNLGVLRGQGKFVGDLGEWLAGQIWGLEPARQNQRGHDLVDSGNNGEKWQVKTHAKAIKNPARKTHFGYERIEEKESQQFQYLLILVLTPDFYFDQIFRLTYNEAFEVAKKSKSGNINWSSCEGHEIGLDDLPNQDLVNRFKKPKRS